MKCKQCGGDVMCMQHAVYYTDGSTSGTYNCNKCGKTKGWFIKGNLKEEVINFEEDLK